MQNNTVWFREPKVLVTLLQEKPHSESMSLSECLRDISRRDLRQEAA